ncbi:SDR family oxidoreductase [Segnochrobactrum spirostomi]|uniref:SDR family NAD(P)-dependent oxidoreductase n=1 Tax=Segnochrobactrum spirostomi TaxID=2608987 RepID=A0A6A7YBN1_9HYPH|nr:SDR family NAD(P)-dependent oxidoreductase [Segnochrobactrum spirostomi]MQT15391.1 SDR family NAD(P)-dependent oxidoreductase [Segnochrobactrum spirostomi]
MPNTAHFRFPAEPRAAHRNPPPAVALSTNRTTKEACSMDYSVALVTGASRGIGAAIAAALIAEGLVVHALARDAAALAALADVLGPNLKPLPADVRDISGIAAALGDIALDVLVNNAGGVASVRPLQSQTPDETAETIALNLTAPLHLMQIVLPGMVRRGRGHIFNLTSTVASAVFPGTTAYAAAKAGLSQAGRVIRHDLAGSGVRLTEIAPGRVETEFYLRAFDGNREGLRESMYTHQRALRPEDIARVLVAALKLPDHVDIAEMIVSPSEQAPGGHTFPMLAETPSKTP